MLLQNVSSRFNHIKFDIGAKNDSSYAIHLRLKDVEQIANDSFECVAYVIKGGRLEQEKQQVYIESDGKSFF